MLCTSVAMTTEVCASFFKIQLIPLAHSNLSLASEDGCLVITAAALKGELTLNLVSWLQHAHGCCDMFLLFPIKLFLYPKSDLFN